jgi:predicted histidine transporter YuiF (NhaC family)
LQVLNQIISSKMETAAEVKMEANAIDTSTAQKKNEPLAQQNDEQCEERKLLAAMLSLTVVICNKLMDKDDLNHVDIIDAELVQKLMNIIESNSSAAADCLGVVKLACQVVIAVIQAKPICVEDLNEDDFNRVMSEALAAMSDLDFCMVFASNDGDIAKPNRSLQSLVKEAQELFGRSSRLT